MDFGRILGALVNGAATPPRRAPARRGRGPLGMTAAETRQVGRVLGSLVGAAMEAMKAPPAQTAPPPATKRPAPRDLPGPAPRIPQTGGSPWTPRPGAPPAEPVATVGAEHSEALLLTRAMVAAARADGVTDAAERAAIARQLDTAGLTAAERDHVLAGFDSPATPEALAREATDPMLRAQLYAACVAAMGEISPPERAWLDRLGAALKLDAAARASIEKRLG